MSFANSVGQKIKNIHGLVNIDKDRGKNNFCWHDDTVHAYKSLYLQCGTSK